MGSMSVHEEKSIRVRVCLAVVEGGMILLVPHYNTDAGSVQWVIPGGEVEFGESLQSAARREVFEETGLQCELTGLLHTSEVILPDRPYHSITLTYTGRVSGGSLRAEANHPHGEKLPRWFSAEDLLNVPYHPQQAVQKALGIPVAAVS